MTPRRLCTDSEWAEINDGYGWLQFQKRDGRVWDWNQNDKAEVISFGDDAKPMYRNEVLEGVRPGAAAWWNTGFGGSQLGICDDGTLRIISSWQMQTNLTKSGRPRNEFVQAKRRTQIGNESIWVALVSTAVGLVALKADGALWHWEAVAMRNPSRFTQMEPHEFTSTRLDSYTDWVGLCPMHGGVVALAADGSLWLWSFNSLYRSYNDTLLGAPRKPRLLGNIFASAGQ